MDLYLITGFLGAGKTSLLKNILPYFQNQKLSVIVNEFGKEGMDAQLISQLEASVTEIAGGAVFCSCRVDQFEAVLKKTIQDGFQVVLLEASGLADPGNIEKILAQPAFSSITYKGGLCMVDPLTFPKVSATVRVCKKQLSACRTVILNKADLATPHQLAEATAQIQALNPTAVIHTTRFGKIPLQWLQQTAPVHSSEPVIQTKDLGLQKKFIRFHQISQYQLGKFVEMIVEDTHRLKGFVQCTDGVVEVNCVGPQVQIQPYTPNPSTVYGLTALAGAGLPMEKAIQNAVKWYPDQVAQVE